MSSEKKSGGQQEFTVATATATVNTVLFSFINIDVYQQKEDWWLPYFHEI